MICHILGNFLFISSFIFWVFTDTTMGPSSDSVIFQMYFGFFLELS